MFIDVCLAYLITSIYRYLRVINFKIIIIIIIIDKATEPDALSLTGGMLLEETVVLSHPQTYNTMKPRLKLMNTTPSVRSAQ